MIKYVKPTATKTTIPKTVAEPEYKLTAATKTAILKLKKINEETVKILTKTSRRTARDILGAMHEAGEIKTYSERYSELYPSEETP